LLAGLGLVTLTHAQTGANPSATTPAPADGPPRIIATSPKSGVNNVDPALKEITVTFDRDMEGGMSWTGSGPAFPKLPAGAKPHWQDDKRTCVLPVTLQTGRDYRVGINAPSYQNFRSAAGVPAAPTVIVFRTSGLKVESKAPEIVSLDPPNGARDVSPALTELRVTFNMVMGGGCSWTGGGPKFPAAPAGKKPFWSKDGKTCVLPVELKPGTEYLLGLNSLSNKGFQSDDGIPLKPVSYTFKTSDNP
jgi:hypothetical protein